MNAIELLKEARGASVKVLDGLNARIDRASKQGEPIPVYDGIVELYELIGKINAYLATPAPDAMEIVDKLEKLLNMDQAIFPPQSSYSEAAALIANYGRRVPRAMLEFPRQPNKEGGWTIEYSCTEKTWEALIETDEYCRGLSMEEVESVLLFAEKFIKDQVDKFGYRVE